MIMVVRVVHCRWYVSCESPQGIFLVLYSGTNHMGGLAKLVHIERCLSINVCLF